MLRRCNGNQGLLDDDSDNSIIFHITKQQDKPNSLCRCRSTPNPPKVGNVRDKSNTAGLVSVESNLLINVNDSLQSSLADSKINVPDMFPENFRCIVSGPSECGKTFLLKNLILYGVDFEKLYIIDPTGDQYNDLTYIDIEFTKKIKELPSPDKLPKDIKNLILFDNVRAREPVIKEYFGRHNKCNMIYLNQNLS